MKKNLTIAGMAYALAVTSIIIYLSLTISVKTPVHAFCVVATIFFFFALGFSSYLIYFLRQEKLYNEASYLDYLGFGIRIKMALLTSAVLGALLGISLFFFLSKTWIEHIDIFISMLIFIVVNTCVFLFLKPRP